jgi:hypothetical protein
VPGKTEDPLQQAHQPRMKARRFDCPNGPNKMSRHTEGQLRGGTKEGIQRVVGVKRKLDPIIGGTNVNTTRLGAAGDAGFFDCPRNR